MFGKTYAKVVLPPKNHRKHVTKFFREAGKTLVNLERYSPAWI
jgi:hypothetical protein